MKRLIAPSVGLLLALLIGAGGLLAHATEPRVGADAASEGGIGSVDMEEVYNASGAPKELDQAARQDEADGARRINAIMAVPYLEPVELEEYGSLVGKARLAPEEEKRADKLKSMNADRVAEVGKLQTKANDTLTAEEKLRLTHLVELRQTLQTQVRPGLVADFRSQHEGWLSDFRHRQIVKLRQEVARVAKEKGISHVFDAGTLVYSVNDVTPTVLQHLKKSAR